MSSVIARSSLGRGWLGMHTAMGWKEWQVEAELATLLTAGRSEQLPNFYSYLTANAVLNFSQRLF